MVWPQPACGPSRNLAYDSEFDEARHNNEGEWKPYRSNAAAARDLIFAE